MVAPDARVLNDEEDGEHFSYVSIDDCRINKIKKRKKIKTLKATN
jgi:hypothetical protein